MAKYTHVRLVARADDGTEQELLHPTEPFFLVRGQDVNGPAMVGIYRELTAAAGGDVAGLDELQGAFHEWQADNPGLVKAPD